MSCMILNTNILRVSGLSIVDIDILVVMERFACSQHSLGA